MDITIPGQLSPEQVAERTGIMEGALPQENEPEPENQPKPKEIAKEEEIDETEPEDGEEENDDDSKEKPKDEGKKERNRSPIKAAFAQIGELQSGQKELAKVLGDVAEAVKQLKDNPKSTEIKEEVQDSIEALAKEVEEAGGDRTVIERLAKLLKTSASSEVMKELNSIREILSQTATKTEELHKDKEIAKQQERNFDKLETEWKSFLPDLKKAYPNATESMLEDAFELMSELAVNKQYGGEEVGGDDNKGKAPMPMDYILFKEKSRFDSLLKIASKGKSGEDKDGNPERDYEEGEEIDLNPESMTPEKYKRYMNGKLKDNNPEDVKIIIPR